MEFTNTLQLVSGAVGATVVIIIGATCLLAIVGHLQLKEPQILPPGPRGWPVVGNLPLLASAGAENMHRLFTQLAKQYGPIVFLRLGSVPSVVVSSAAMSSEFLKTHDAVFYTARGSCRAPCTITTSGACSLRPAQSSGTCARCTRGRM